MNRFGQFRRHVEEAVVGPFGLCQLGTGEREIVDQGFGALTGYLFGDQLTPGDRRALAGHEDRLTWDAPIHGVADIEALFRQMKASAMALGERLIITVTVAVAVDPPASAIVYSKVSGPVHGCGGR